MNARRLLMPMALTALAALCGNAAAQGAFPAPLPGQSTPASSPAASPFPDPRPAGARTTSSPAPTSASPFPNPPGATATARPAAPAAGAPASASVFSSGAAPVGAVPGGGLAPQQQGTADQEECMAKFAPLKQDAEKRANAIRAASERKATAQEACGLIKQYVTAEAKLVNYVTAKQTACNIPPDVPKQLKANQARTNQMMTSVCKAAAQQAQGGPASAGPSLSEVLGSPSSAPEVRTVRSGGSTFDTINGNVLSR